MAIDSPLHHEAAQIRWLGIVGGIENTPLWPAVESMDAVVATFDGLMLDELIDRHYGRIRQYRGYQVDQEWGSRRARNERQVSIATAEDLLKIADDLELRTQIEQMEKECVAFMASALAVNVVVDGEELKPQLGPGTRLFIGKPNDGAMLRVSEAHFPCSKPAFALARMLDRNPQALKVAFKEVARERRGYMSMVDIGGWIVVGDAVAIQQPIDVRTPDQIRDIRIQGL